MPEEVEGQQSAPEAMQHIQEVHVEQPHSFEDREVAEQEKQFAENVDRLRGNLRQFSEDDPNLPPRQETLDKLSNADYLLYGAKKATLASGITFGALAGILEAGNYFGGGPAAPGELAKIMLVLGAGVAGPIDVVALAAKGEQKLEKGYEKLRGLIATRRKTGAEGQQPPSNPETGENKT